MPRSGVRAFRLRFPLSEVKHWASRYSYADDAEVEAIGRTARERGSFSRSEFLTVARWKTPRSQGRCARNTAAMVRSRTQLALTAFDERLRIGALTQLHGIELPTASVLLHLAHRDPYPIIDFRALWSLGIEEPPASYSFAYWSAYVTTCRELATAARVRMRTLDRALWQYSKEHQPTRRGRPPVTAAVAGRVGRDRGLVRPPRRSSKPDAHMPGGRTYPYRADIHARLIETAMSGGTITYSGLGTGRRMVGSYLYRIAAEEAAAARPPLTALVVHKGDGKPGHGFLEAAKWVSFWREGETEDEVWQRAVQAVHDYWRPKLGDGLE